VSFEDLAAALSEPEVGPKDGAYFVRGPFNGTAKRADEHIAEANAVILDADSRIDTETGELLPGAPHPVLVHEVLTDADIRHHIYSSHSHGGEKGNRYRVVVPAALGPERRALLATVDHLIGIIGSAGVPLAAAKENYAWAQAWFLPRIRKPGAEFLAYTHDTDEALDVAGIVATWQRAQPQVETAVAPDKARPRRQRGLIGSYLGEHGGPEQITERLVQAGYQLRGSAQINGHPAYRFLHPRSSSKQPGVVLFRSKAGIWRVVSFHGDYDPLAELDTKTGKPLAHDAFDVLRILEHGGQVGEALRAIDPRPTIRIYGGSLAANTEQAIRALADQQPPVVYQRGSMLARVAHLPETTEIQGVTVPRGTATLIPIDATDLRLRLAEAALFERARPGKNDEPEWHPADPPPALAQTVLASAGDWERLPVLVSLAEAPILRADGSVHDAPGYDPGTRLYHEGRAPALMLSTHPARDEAARAARYLLRPFAEFPFADREKGIDEAVVLAYLLTLVQRPMLPLAPLFGFSATAPGTGKGLLVEVCNLIARGRDAAIMPPPGGQSAEEETRKRITALLLQGVSSVLLDNWTTAIGGDSMNALLTSASWSDRVLGKSQTVTLPACVTWAATGNNLSVRGDMVRRTLLAVIDAQVERPEQRRFEIKNLTAHALKQRRKLLSAAFTILRAYRQAGEPDADQEPLGRFETWSRSCAAPIRWLGWPDPVLSQERLRADDPETQKLSALLAAWHRVFADQSVTVAAVIETATSEFLAAGIEPEARYALREALEDVAGDRPGQVNRRKLGWYLRHFAGRVSDGLAVFADSSRKDRARYRVVRPVRSVA
jgi:hypothetical protein